VRILTRYILKEIVSHALIGLALFTFLVFMREIGRLMEPLVRNSASLGAIGKVFLYLLPTVLTLSIPMAALVGVLLGLGRLAADSEIVAMRASGIGSWRMVRIISLFALATWGLASFNNLYLAPRAAAALVRLQDKLKSAQAGFEVQPHIFYEDFKNYVLYVQDTSAANGAAEWRDVFLADVSTPGDPKVTLAQRALVTQQAPGELRLHLEGGEEHALAGGKPNEYEITTFSESDIPVQIPAAQPQATPTATTAELSAPDLLRAAASSPDPVKARWYLIEYHRRLALPAACLVLALVGIPLGLSARRGGKATGFVLAIVLVFLYYFISLAGIALARQGKAPPSVAVWMANLVFFVLGTVLMVRVNKRPLDLLGWLRASVGGARAMLRRRAARPPAARPLQTASVGAMVRRRRLWSLFPQILDDYIVRDFLMYVGMVLASFVLLFLIFTLFELLSDILRNSVPLGIVAEYLLDVVPWAIYNFALPMAVLVSVLVTFGLMSRANEITALKATGVSIYRVVAPVILIAATLAAALFFVDQLYLPRINRRQETLRNRIKGKPPQTYLRPDRKWIFGEHHTIYYYQFYDAERLAFGNVTVFEFDPASFQITRRVHAARAHWEPDTKWVFEKGWVRQFNGSAIAGFEPFEVKTFAELDEAPGYFRKEVKQSSEMSYDELRRYIQELQQSGFEVSRLKVQLQKKIAFPLITFVMAILAIPFSLASNKRGALTGVATAIGIAVVYWVSAGLLEDLGNVNQLPPLLAAWAPDILFALGGGYLLLKVPT
jgi:LPS export ABC transporter permease LptG/LPS export ABC transporter permease LptF